MLFLKIIRMKSL